ncbi:MAG: Peptidoglycan lytic protein P45 [uncultured Sulfurovum sp.]|uniref:Peptidoglycan lytic protein P45 n=1 Tax=uncultured Sulfurovum sp. TaxID=269237 RepID=A0A6S6RSF4_9BACT|nr:MAG: Peptidoglycan lytic protein P45 [uncultured Sulfurovum sp.]
MKINIFGNLILLTSVTLFTACSNASPKPEDKKLSTLAIIGINDSVSLPMARTYPVDSGVSTHMNASMPNPLHLVRHIEKNAKTLLGIKYVWGATGPYTYDCSGFTQKIYRDAGINIPRVSRDQARVGQFIAYDNLRRGDMVFFDTKKKRTGIVSHVGIYLGSGNFIHASSAAKKIVIYNFNDQEFYKKRFLWGRRVVGDNYHMASL